MQNPNVKICPTTETLEFLIENIKADTYRLERIQSQIAAYAAKYASDIEFLKKKIAENEAKAGPIIAALEYPKGKKSKPFMGAIVGQRKGKDKWEVADPTKAVAVLKAANCFGYIRIEESVNVAQVAIAPLPEEIAEKAGIKLIEGKNKPFIKL